VMASVFVLAIPFFVIHALHMPETHGVCVFTCTILVQWAPLLVLSAFPALCRRRICRWVIAGYLAVVLVATVLIGCFVLMGPGGSPGM
jgi:hypothetical protein